MMIDEFQKKDYKEANRFMRIIWYLSFGIYLLSLTQRGFYLEERIPANDYYGYTLLTIGWLGFLNGVLGVVWSANLFYFFALLLFINKNHFGFILAVLSALIGGGFILVFHNYNITLSEGGCSKCNIVSLASGYYLWLTSFIILTIGSGIEVLKS